MDDLKEKILLAKDAIVTLEIKKLAVSCLDLTSLNDMDTADTVRSLCQRALTPLGNVAAVCVYPQFVTLAKEILRDTGVKVATVVNFPHGDDSMNEVLLTTKTSLLDGADEIDMVLPYKKYLMNEHDICHDLIVSVKTVCGDRTLKVILESGELHDSAMIASASKTCLQAGADFLKTSTGKKPVGATLEAAAVMLSTIKQYGDERVIGFKASGGVRTSEDAAQYIQLARYIMGKSWISPRTFRLGASSLLTHLLDGITTTDQY